MQIKIQATNMELTEALADYVEKRLSSLSKYIRNEGDALIRVEIGKTTHHHGHGDVFRAEANMSVKGVRVRAESKKDDLYAAIDDVREELERMLSTEKDKRMSLMRRGGARVKALVQSAQGMYGKIRRFRK